MKDDEYSVIAMKYRKVEESLAKRMSEYTLGKRCINQYYNND
ncbi:15388_t:CDS:2 [Funneliformis caledonium]|uniref:15388_t:CDS:1 n=1 Tax=Funneliformis caledonium TaxID=1117310 RepID=A0A9N9GNT4_9GLOM|nr:15388_t:CDS:2 [Funneliformis caledonium]